MSKEKRDALLLELKQIVANGEATENISKNKAKATEKEIKILGNYAILTKEIGELEEKIRDKSVVGLVNPNDLDRIDELKKKLADIDQFYADLFAEFEDEPIPFKLKAISVDVSAIGTINDKDIEIADALNEKWDKIRKTKELAYNTAIDLSGSLLEISNNLTQTEIDNQEMIRDSKIKSLDDQLERGTINEKKYQSEKTKAEKKADQEIASLRLKQQEREKAVASFQAILKGGLATLQAFIELGPIAGALVGLSVAAEVAAIQSQPLPKFEKGGLIQGKSHRQGGVIIEAEGNEFIVNKLQTPKHMDVLEHINKGSFEEYNKRRYIIPALKKERENIRQSIINSFNDANLLSSDQKNREILREIRDALKEGRPYTNKRKI